MKTLQWVALAYVCALTACAAPTPERTKAREEFMKLKASYLKFCETPEVFVTKPFSSPEGRAILAMGMRALPFIIEEIRNGEPHWKWAAFYIVPAPPPPPDATWEELITERNRELQERYSRDWVNWWDKNRSTLETNDFRTDD